MFSKTWMLTILSAQIIQMAPQLESWGSLLVSWLVGGLVTWAGRNKSKGIITKANPITGVKSGARKAWSKK